MFRSILKKLTGEKSGFFCMACEKRIPECEAALDSLVINVCRECMGDIDSFKSPTVFRGRKNLRFVIAAYPYSGILRGSFIKYKFSGQKAYSYAFAAMLADAVKCFYKKDDFDMVVPVPLSKQRMNERGYNQAALVAKSLAEKLDIEYSEIAVFRVKNTRPQSSVSGNERMINVKDAFVADKTKVDGKRILLVDDIYTMGATMEECAKELILRGAKTVAGAVIFKTILNDEKEVFEFETVGKDT